MIGNKLTFIAQILAILELSNYAVLADLGSKQDLIPRALRAPGALSMANTRMAPGALRTNLKPSSSKAKAKPKTKPSTKSKPKPATKSKPKPKPSTKKAPAALRKTPSKQSVKPASINKPGALRASNLEIGNNAPGALRALKTPGALSTQRKRDRFGRFTRDRFPGTTPQPRPKPQPRPQPRPVVKPTPKPKPRPQPRPVVKPTPKPSEEDNKEPNEVTKPKPGKETKPNVEVSKPAQKCRPVRRKEVRDLTPAELKRYINAIKKLHTIKDGKGSKFDKYAEMHIEAHRNVHGVPAFLPWHRQFIRKYELDLQEIDPKIVLPFWDWTIDSQNPEKSPILSSEMFGGNGDSNKDNCLTEGPFANWNVIHPTPHCLRRDYAGGSTIPAFTSTDVMQGILQDVDNYEDFAYNIEVHHGPVHLDIGGDRGDLQPMHSPNDPLFFLHHTFVDMLWYNWQRMHPKAKQYEGYAKSKQVTTQDDLHLLDFKVEDLLDTRNPHLCYYYDPYHPEVSSLQKRTGFDFKTLAHRQITNKTDDIADPEDRKTKGILRGVDKLPAKWIEMNNLDPNRVRQIEEERDTITENLNALGVDKVSQLD